MFKKTSVLLLTVVGFIPSVLGAESFNDNSATPVQVFEQAGQGASTDLAKSNFSPLEDHPRANQPNIHADQLLVSEKSAKPQLQTLQDKPSVESSATKSSQQSLQDAIDTIDRTNIIYRQSVDSRIEALSNQLQEANEHLKKLDEVMLLLNNELSHLNKTNPSATHIKKSFVKSHVTQFKHFVVYWIKTLESNFGFYSLIIIIALVLLIAAWIFLSKSKRGVASKSDHSALVSNINKEDETEGEYDYMGSKESIPAKLNLARAYIAMEDYNSAHKAIQEVLSKGNSSQCDEAHALLDKISEVKT